MDEPLAAVPDSIERVMRSLLERTAELAPRLAGHIRANVPLYRRVPEIGAASLEDVCAAQLTATFAGFADAGGFDVTQALLTGRERAETGIPLSVVMDAYRVAAGFVWQIVADAAREAGVPDGDLIAVTARVWAAQNAFTQAMAETYRDGTTLRLLAEQDERSALIDALITGRRLDQGQKWDVADLLGLPADGPFVVLAAAVVKLGRHPLPGVVERLAGLDVPSAWKLLPDAQIGIASPSTRARRERLTQTLEQYSGIRIGVSPGFTDLNDAGPALRFARIAMTGTDHPGGVTVFDEAPLSVVSVAEPDVMRHVVSTVLGPLASMRPDDRDLLLGTLDAWMRNGGSADAAGRELYCHPNTVRQRLRRIEERTGRSLTDPRQLAELCIALESSLRLGLT